ncbi:hypothetical protein DFH11DRAFT_697141 [Phellopilus nigrolimitatus]|nr:hypothetical protein DFH11DRAFT_697141 [Phellopilus nigrolimitatus]
MPRSTKAGHVKRPWNRFFCFMYSDDGKKIQSECSVGQDKKRLVSDKWNAMTTEEREPYVLEAEKRKKEHKALYPDYHYQVEQTVESSKARGSIRSRKIPGNVAAELRTQEQRLNHQIIVFSAMPEHEASTHFRENLEHREYKWDTVRVGTLDSYSSMLRQAATPLHAVTTETDGRLENTLPSSPLSGTHPEILNNLSLLIPPESDYSPSTLTSLPSPSSNSSPWPSPFPSPDSAFSNASLPSSAYEPIACPSNSSYSDSALGLDLANTCIQAPAGGDAQDILSDFDFWRIDPVNEFLNGVASMRNSYELQPRVGQSHWPSLLPALSTPPLAHTTACKIVY